MQSMCTLKCASGKLLSVWDALFVRKQITEWWFLLIRGMHAIRVLILTSFFRWSAFKYCWNLSVSCKRVIHWCCLCMRTVRFDESIQTWSWKVLHLTNSLTNPMIWPVLNRYNRHDKRSKLPGWILSHLRDAHLNLSTDMSVHIAREVQYVLHCN